MTRGGGNRHGLLVRVIAVFFLLYTGADLASPQFCTEELEGFSGYNQVSAATLSPTSDNARPTLAASVSDSSRQEPPSDKTPDGDEDCFCCCAHVLPGMTFAVVQFTAAHTPVPDVRSERIPSPTLPNTYHPPRLA